MVLNGKEKRKIAIRVDASEQIGSGHLMRCLTLADSIKDRAEIHFITRKLKGSLPELIAEKGYAVHELPSKAPEEPLQGYEKWLTVKRSTDAKQTRAVLRELKAVDWLIVDHYALDESWEKDMRPYAKKIFVIDDLANRRHDCDILLDQNYSVDKNRRYNRLVSEKCKSYCGLEYLILRQEFYEQIKKEYRKGKALEQILVFFGGSDDTKETLKILEAIQKLNNKRLRWEIVVGAANKEKELIKEICQTIPGVKYYCQVENIAELIGNADIAFGAAGTHAWERCFLGLPAIITITAENQKEIAQSLSEKEASYLLGWHEDVGIEEYLNIIRDISKLDLQKMSKENLKLIGESKLHEVIQNILQGEEKDENRK